MSTPDSIDGGTSDPPFGAAAPGTPHGLPADRLAQINRLATIARFVSGLAHELNNSLQVIGGLVELLADRADLPADALVRIQKIGGQADRASTVIRQVLAFVREPMTERGSADLADVIERSLALRRYQLGRQGIAVEWQQPSGPAIQVAGQDRALQQIVLNLLANAEEALVGQPQRQLHVVLERADRLAQVTVADSGPGVPADCRARIFEPFFSTRNTERALGLGLTVSAALAASYGGRLYLADAAPGATFVLELPVGG